jgi:MFS family permease
MPKQQRFKKDRQFWKFCAYGFLKNLRFFEPFLILFFLEKGISYWQIGILYAIREIAINVLEIPSGFLADAFGRRRTMMLAFAFYIVSFLVFFLADQYSLIAVAMVLYALGDAFRSGVHKAMIFTYLKLNDWSDQKVHYYGHTRSWSQRGSAISSLLAAGVVIFSKNYSAVFLLSIIPYLLDMLLIWSYPKALDGEKVDWKDRRAIRAKFSQLWHSFSTTFRHPRILRAVNNVSLFSGFFKATKDYLQPILQALALGFPFFTGMADKSRSAVLIGIVYFGIYWLTAWASQSAGRISDRFATLRSPVNWSLAVGLVIGILIGITYHWKFALISVGLYILLFAVENLRKPMGTAFVAEAVDEAILASVLSAQSQIKTVWSAMIALGLGASIEAFGVAGGLGIISIILLLLVPILWIRETSRSTKI